VSPHVLVEVRRGAIVEARHRGSIIALEPSGRVVASLGDHDAITSTRSAIKPIQAIPVITSGAADRFNFSEREIALTCASHNGEPIHTEGVEALLARVGLSEKAARCGAHRPYCEETARKLEKAGVPFNQLHNNCSGKHAGMLATAVHLGLELEDYVSADHPIQIAITSLLRRLGDIQGDLAVAVDGCSAPTFGISPRSLALMFARLVNCALKSPASSNPLNESEQAAARRIISAMIAHPELVGGTSGRLDTDLIRAAAGKLISKIGAESLYAIGVLPCERFPNGLGIAIKIEDGAKRGLNPTVIETLLQLGAIGAAEREQLTSYHRERLISVRGREVGEVVPVFDLGIAK